MRRRKRKLRQILESLTVAENMGDVADHLLQLGPALGLGTPRWDDYVERLVWPWEKDVPSQDDPFDPDWVVHPGATVREGRENEGLTVEDLASILAWSVDMVLMVENGEMPITPEMAYDLGAWSGSSQQFWLNHERNFRTGLAAGKHWEK